MVVVSKQLKLGKSTVSNRMQPEFENGKSCFIAGAE